MKRIAFALIVGWTLIALCACGEKVPTWQEQYDLGVRYLSEGNYEEAIIAFTAAIEIDPKQAPAYVGRGDAYVASGKTEENLAVALADYEKAIELDEANAEAYLGLANVYAHQGEYEKALEVLQVALGENGDNQKIADRISDLKAEYISSMVEAGNYNFLFNNVNDVVMPWEWKINGKSFDQCELSDFQFEYPDESGHSLTTWNDKIYYRPGLWQDGKVVFGNIEVRITAGLIEIDLLCDACYRPDLCYPPNFRNISTDDTYDSVLQKIGFSDIGIEFMKTLEDDFTYFIIHDMSNANLGAKFGMVIIVDDDVPSVDSLKTITIRPAIGQESVYPNARGMMISFTFYDESLAIIQCSYNKNYR